MIIIKLFINSLEYFFLLNECSDVYTDYPLLKKRFPKKDSPKKLNCWNNWSVMSEPSELSDNGWLF